VFTDFPRPIQPDSAVLWLFRFALRFAMVLETVDNRTKYAFYWFFGGDLNSRAEGSKPDALSS
jgi:hypothetical protein